MRLFRNGGNESHRSGGNESNRRGGDTGTHGPTGMDGPTETDGPTRSVQGWAEDASYSDFFSISSATPSDCVGDAREVAEYAKAIGAPSEPTSEGTGPSAVAGNPAVAANPEVHPEVAAADDVQQRRIFDLAYFQNYGDITYGYKAHSAALKYFREQGELAGVTEIIFSNTEVADVAQISHPKGMQYKFDESKRWYWRWQEMVALLDDKSMRLVVEGPTDIPAKGLVSCKIAETDVYDHKRHFAQAARSTAAAESASSTAVAESRMLKVWNFVLERDDGTTVNLHPNWADTKVQCSYGVIEKDHELPLTGKGGTSGPRTYKWFKDKRTDVTLKFDAKKFRPRPAPKPFTDAHPKLL